MEDERVAKVTEELELERQIVGVRFLVYEKDFENSTAEAVKGKNRLCGYVNKANHGARIKVVLDNFSCTGGPNQTGMSQASESHISGQGMKHCGLYTDLGIGREICDSFSRIPQKIFALEIGPLSKMEEADVVIILGMAEQIMRIMEGYAFHYGVPKPLISAGNGAMCSDMTAKPFMRNDINLSVMCCGARTSTVSGHGELGVGMPSHMFRYVADGVLSTAGSRV
ncbi:hypothetical protein K280104A7_02400 [Candidatus Bariatricus faecipullorum]